MFILCTPSVTRELVIRKEQWKSQLVAFVSIYYYLVMLSSLWHFHHGHENCVRVDFDF
jgi:hypothetical protein